MNQDGRIHDGEHEETTNNEKPAHAATVLSRPPNQIRSAMGPVGGGRRGVRCDRQRLRTPCPAARGLHTDGCDTAIARTHGRLGGDHANGYGHRERSCRDRPDTDGRRRPRAGGAQEL